MRMPSRLRSWIVREASSLGRVVEDEKTAKGHLPFIVTVIVRFRGDPACSHGENTKALGALGLEDRLERRTRPVIQRNLDAVPLEGRADVEHVRERALGDEQVLAGRGFLGDDDGEPAPHEVVGNFVDLVDAGRGQSGALACRHDRRVKRVRDPGFEGRVEKGEPSDSIRWPVSRHPERR